jgi:hypothetical protein
MVTANLSGYLSTSADHTLAFIIKVAAAYPSPIVVGKATFPIISQTGRAITSELWTLLRIIYRIPTIVDIAGFCFAYYSVSADI